MKYCMRCGTQLTDGTAFCMNCGTPVASNPYGNSQPYRQPQYQHNAYRQPQYNQVPPNRQQPYGYRDPFQTAPVDYAGPQYYQQPRQNVGLLDWLTGKVNQFAGGQGAVRPPLHHLFSETFQKHTQEEAEEIFACGSPKTTPRLSAGDTLWPKPWLYARILVALALAFFMLYICFGFLYGPCFCDGLLLRTEHTQEYQLLHAAEGFPGGRLRLAAADIGAV